MRFYAWVLACLASVSIFAVVALASSGNSNSTPSESTAAKAVSPKASDSPSTQMWLERFLVEVPSGLSNPMAGPIPPNWEAPHTKNGIHDYALVSDGSEVFLRGKYIPGTSGKVIFKKIDWDLKQYPYISWKWRARAWATGSKINDSRKEDSTASVYVSLRSGIRAYVIKYIWAESDVVGETYSKGEWNPSGRVVAIVIRSGGKLNEWVSEKRNFAEDFKNLYKKDLPSPFGRGIGVMTEGDGTKTEPEADYDDFQVLSN